MVEGGFEVTSYNTLLTPLTSLTILEDILDNNYNLDDKNQRSFHQYL